MSCSKRNSSKWLQSSFDTEESADNSCLKKKRIYADNDKKKYESESFTSFNSNILFKKKPTNLLHLMSACAPQKPSELAVSRQKQQEIIKWFKEKITPGEPNILVVSGPSGCGKTEAVKVIATDNKYDVIEWITPMDQIMDENNRIMRQGERFEDFLIRATRYSSVLSDCSKRILLVKDLPNSYIEEKDNFSSLLEKYCKYGREPLIFINTETGNSRTITTLFSDNNCENFRMQIVKVNATTPTALKNVMKRVSTILNNKASQILHVTQNVIDNVLSNTIGDVRSALLNLIFSSLKVTKKVESECTIREESLSLFHGIGRIIHPKKNGSGSNWKFTHDPDELASCFQTQSNTVIRFIHENYLNTMGFNMDGASKAIDAISLADVFNSEWRDIKLSKVALTHCIRGVMMANDRPISQWNPVRKPSNVEYNVQRNHANAEFEWYKNYIYPKTKTKLIEEELTESIIEEIEW